MITVLTVNDLQSPTIRCPLNVNGLLPKQSVKALTAVNGPLTLNKLTIFCPAMYIYICVHHIYKAGLGNFSKC